MTKKESAPVAVDASEVYAFEAVGFVSSRKMFEKLDALEPDEDTLWKRVRQHLEPLGFTGVDEVYLSEDDGQGSRDIKVFVVVRLRGPEGLADNFKGELPEDLTEALDTLSNAVCYSSGQDRVGAENWEFSNAYEFE